MSRLITYVVLVVMVGVSCQNGDVSQEADVSIESYRQQRELLFREMDAGRKSSSLQLSEEEELVDAHLAVLRNEILNNRPPKEVWSATYFPLVQHKYRDTKLYEFFRKMPKGAILHIHPAAMGDYRALLASATYRPDAFINRKGQMAILKGEVDSSWMKIEELRAKAMDVTAFDDSLHSLITLGAEDMGVQDIWSEFEGIFGRIWGLMSVEEIYSEYVENALRYYAVQDNVQHMELRTHLPNQVALDNYKDMIKKLEAEGVELTVRLIASDSRVRRSDESDTAFVKRLSNNLDKAAFLRQSNPDLLVGVDIYSEEDDVNGATAFDMASVVLEAQEHSKEQYGIDLPLYLHDGESNRPLSFNYTAGGKQAGKNFNNNIYDSYLLKTERVGHGLELGKLPSLAKKYRDEGIAVEVCPISNQILGYVSDLRIHPAISLLNQGVAITISPDDPAIFGYQGVSFDYLAICLAWGLDLADIKSLIITSIDESALSPAEKKELFEKWNRRWEEFIKSYIE